MQIDFPLSLKELRLALGLSQADMAGLLQIERGKLSMAELGLRPIGGRAFRRLDLINQILMQNPDSDEKEIDLSQWKAEVKAKLEADYRKAQKQVEKLKAGQEANRRLRLLLSHISSLAQPEFKSVFDIRWAEMMAAAMPNPQEAAEAMLESELRLAALKKQLQLIS
jgi:transcriptional regulator with XRE-family HTH domain